MRQINLSPPLNSVYGDNDHDVLFGNLAEDILSRPSQGLVSAKLNEKTLQFSMA